MFIKIITFRWRIYFTRKTTFGALNLDGNSFSGLSGAVYYNKAFAMPCNVIFIQEERR